MCSVVTLLFITLSLVGTVYSDYDCLCNYNVEKTVLPSASSQGQPIGYLYEFDCKELLGHNANSATWASVAFEHQIGYVEKDAQTQTQVCPGEPPLIDKVTTTSTVATTITTTQKPNTTPTSTMKPTSTSTTMKPTTSLEPTTTTITMKPTTTITMKPTTTTTTTTTTTMKPTTTKTMRPTTTTTTMKPTTTSTTLKTSTLPTTKSTTTTFSTSTSNPTPVSSAATSLRTETSSTTIMTSIVTPNRPDTSTTRSTGKYVCPLNVQQAALSEGSLAFVNDDNRKCYEFVKFKRTWSFAENDCKGKGGHLTSIENTDEEKLLNGYVQTYGSNTWIGLNDKNSEENFEWSSGDTLSYQNWQTGRKDPIKHTIEDCVTMRYGTGAWEDENCGSYYAYICKFDAVLDNGMNRLTTPTYTTSTPLPTSTTSFSSTTSGKENLQCPQNVYQEASKWNEKIFVSRDTRKCYEFVMNHLTWSNAESDCQSRGGHLVTVSSATEEQLLYSYVKAYGHTTWIGLNDQNQEEHFEWSSGDPVTYQNWHTGRKDPDFHRFEDCVAMGSLTGTWEDMDCVYKYFAYICEYDSVSSNQGSLPSVDGNTQLCSSTVRHLADRDNAILGQYERGCYELIRTADVSWQHGEDMCQSRGGHLARISSAQQQAFIQSFLHRHSPQHAVWIGLHDTRIEGAFEWTAGTSVSYTNWIPGHTSNFESFRTEDCVAFIPYKNGKWDDIPCGNNYDLGETHPVLCQYKTPISPGIVG